MKVQWKRCLNLFLFGWMLLLLEQGCTYTAAVSQTNVPAERGTLVEARVSKYIFLGFNFDNDEVYRLVDDLKGKCPHGDVRGILTKDLRTLYFLFFFWERETIATGYCKPQKGLAVGDDVMTPYAGWRAAEPKVDVWASDGGI